MNQTTQPRRPKLFIRTIYLFRIILFFFTFNSGSPAQTGWYEQTLPVSGTIYDIEFLNSHTGFISISTPAILKTTNGGILWSVIKLIKIFDLDVIDSTTIYGNGRRDSDGSEIIYRSFDLGNTWDSTVYSLDFGFRSIHFFNKDTGLVSGAFDLTKIVWRTTNRGHSLEQLSTTTGLGVLFFLKEKIKGECYGWNVSSGFMSKTTNSGFNWSTPTNVINGNSGDIISLFFLNRDTGWISFDQNLGGSEILRTTNGGNNWIQQIGLSSTYNATDIKFLNSSKGWSGRTFLKVYATSNGGQLWGLQNTTLFYTGKIEMADTLKGWVGVDALAHTTDGGGIITYVGIDPSSAEIPVSFKLEQNYPNPFNPQTTIKFSVSNASSVSLMIYDITGKETLKIYDNETLIPGNYKIALDFSRRSLSSGTYFYSMKVNDKNSGLLYNETKKMIYLK